MEIMLSNSLMGEHPGTRVEGGGGGRMGGAGVKETEEDIQMPPVFCMIFIISGNHSES